MVANHLFVPDGDTCGVVNGFTVATGFTWLFAVRAGQWIFHSSQSDSTACVGASRRDGSFSGVHCPNYCGARSSILFARRGNLAEITIGIAMSFNGPTVVVAQLVGIPDVIVAVVWIVDTVMMLGASCG